MKVGIIRCMQTEDYCPGTTDFKVIREKKGAFEGIDEDIEIIGFINCGGCPAKRLFYVHVSLLKEELIPLHLHRAYKKEHRSDTLVHLRKE